jgi:hypothetical protein
MKLSVLLGTLFLNLLASGQNTTEEIVHVEAPQVTMQAGRPAMIRVMVKVREGFHIQANQLTDEFLIPTTLQMDGGEYFTFSPPVFPAPEKFKLAGTTDYLEVFGGAFEIQSTVVAIKKINKGLYELAGSLLYQACDSVRCLFPRKAGFSVTVEIK